MKAGPKHSWPLRHRGWAGTVLATTSFPAILAEGARKEKNSKEGEKGEEDSNFSFELPGQLAIKTSSSKKRKLARPPSTKSLDPPSSPSPDTVLPSCEPDDDIALSFSAPSGANTPFYVRSDSLLASSLPPRLQSQVNSLVSAEYASSVASTSPCASAYAELSLESEEGGPATNSTRSQFPFRVSKRAIMNGDAELPRRSSSPLKRRASGMDSEANSADVNAARSEIPSRGNKHPGSLPRSMSVDAPEENDTASVEHVSSQPPPLLEQIKIIEMLLKAFAEAPVEEGCLAYLVSRTWVNQALVLRADSKLSIVSTAESHLGPVDNHDIIEEVIHDSSGMAHVRLKPGANLDTFELFPEDAWKLVMDWYGIHPGQHPIVRQAVNTANSKQDPPNIMFEFHPPVFRVYRLWSEVSPLPIEQALKARNPPPLILARSATSHAQSFLRELKILSGIPMEHKTRLFMVPPGLPATSGFAEPQLAALTPPDSPGGQESSASLHPWRNLLLDIASFSQARESRVSVELADQTANDKFNGQTTLQHYHLTTDQTLVLDEAIGSYWVSSYTGREKYVETQMPSRVNMATSSRNISNRSSPAFDGPLTRGRAKKKRLGRNTGAVGLHNLGNTCYMNSALQCVRSVEELSKYFLTESYLAEINDTNVLGYEGRVAIAYGSLLREIYEEGKSAVSPRDFKSTVGRCRPTFSGWGQQDSQEFLGFLLDALQEDLSRIRKKPYIEKPDSTDDMINNPEAIREMAKKVWDITRRRDDSVIADLFTGMYKSTLKCPECGKISITFDPFNNLTLPLPLENMWFKTVKFLPLNDVPVKIDVELPKHSTVESLKQFISARTGVPTERLMGAEEFKDRFFKIYNNNHDVSEEIQPADTPTMHELEAVPTNWPIKGPQGKPRSMLDIDSPPDSEESDDELCQIMVVPVLHRRPQMLGRILDGTSPPHFITLTREEACSLGTIQRKVLEKVVTFSTWSRFSDHSNESGSSDTAESDMTNVTTFDIDSSGDAKVAIRSVEGEEDLVDISINGSHGKVGSKQPNLLKRFNKRRPNFADPDAFISPELQNIFELCYFRNETDGNVPTGWSSVDGNCTLPRLSDRVPETKEVAQTGAESPETESMVSDNEESSDDDESRLGASQTRMVDESSEEDTALAPKLVVRPGRQNYKLGATGRKKFKSHKTYGKKGNKRRDKQMLVGRGSKRGIPAAVKPKPMPSTVADGGPLIRLYEGIVVDWNEDAWETVFGNTLRRLGSLQGARTFIDLETLEDPALKANQKKRQTCRTKGITLEECLDEFERAEVLSEQDMWYCPRCKEHRRASKKFDLWKTPDILVAHLKRFSSSGWRRDKLDVFVDFPLENLDLTSRVIEKEDGKVEVYDLIAVDDHYGGLGGGHYTAYAKNFVDGRWYSFNDSSVHLVADPTSVVTSAAYLLFYRRRSSVPLGGSRFVGISDKYEKEASLSDEELSEDSGQTNKSDARGTLKMDGDGLPLYDQKIHRSIEDDGGKGPSIYRPLESKSLDMTQGWNFGGLDSGRTDGTPEDDCPSDVARFGSPGDDRSRDLSAQDTQMTASAAVEEVVGWKGQDYIAVPARSNSEGGSDEVAEIHLEGDRKGQMQ